MNSKDTKCDCGGKIVIIDWCDMNKSRCDHCCDSNTDCIDKILMVRCLKCGKYEEKEIGE